MSVRNLQILFKQKGLGSALLSVAIERPRSGVVL